MNEPYDLAAKLAKVRRASFGAAVLGGAGCALGYVVEPKAFFPAYLVAWLFWLGIALGCLVFSMIHNATSGAWGVVLKPVLESAADTIPLVAIFFIPIVCGIHELYPWTNYDVVAADENLMAKAGYLNAGAWIIRAGVYLGLWITLAAAVNRWSADDDEDARVRLEKRRTFASNPGLIIYGLSITFGSIDWGMSIEPDWYSTMYGTTWMAVQAVSGLAFAIAATALVAKLPPWNRVAHPARFHDLGSLLLTAVIFWMYVAFMQYLLVWSGNLSEEIPYYLLRTHDGWGALAVMIAGLGFAIPLAALLSRELKRDRIRLALVSILLLAVQLGYWYWLIIPPFDLPTAAAWQVAAAVVGIGGLWLALFTTRLAIRAEWPFGEEELAGNLDERPRYEAH